MLIVLLVAAGVAVSALVGFMAGAVLAHASWPPTPGVVGVIVYQLVRPINTRADLHERESLERILARGQAACPACGSDVDASFRACPHCAATLKTACPECDWLVELDWRFCPVCAVPLAPSVRAPRVDPAPASAVGRRGTGRPRV